MSATSFRTSVVTVVCLMVLLLHQDVSSTRFNALTEPCLPVTPATTPTLNMTWVSSVKLWYYTVQSYLDLYRAASEAVKTPIPELKASDIYYNACPTIEWSPKLPYLVINIMGESVKFPMTPNLNGSSTYYLDYLKLGGDTTVPLTDNKSYIYFYACWDDGTSSWGIGSTKPEVDESTMKEIFDYSVSIGLDPTMFSYIRYDTCKDVPTVPTHLGDAP